MRPVCSVVIPTRNCLSYLTSALDSVRAQRIDGIEVIVVDDGSTDGTGDWLRGYAGTWPALRVIDGPACGPARARNVAIAAANADLTAFLDADDLWWPGKLERQISDHRARPDVSFSFTDYLHVDLDGGTHGTCFEYWNFRPDGAREGSFTVLRDSEAAVLGSNPVGTSTVMARTRALQIANGFAEDLQSAEDLDLWLRLAAAAPVSATSDVLASYLMHRPGNLSGQAPARLATLSAIVARYNGRKEAAFRVASRKARARLHEARADLAIASRQPVRSLGWRLRALSADPSLRAARAAAGQARGMARALLSR